MSEEPRMKVRSGITLAVRAVARYVATTYEPGSATGRWAIHETRVQKHGVEIDVEEASTTELLDAIALAELRRRVWAKPAKRREPPTPGERTLQTELRCVAPRDMVANVLPSRPTRTSGGGDAGVVAWRLTFSWYLGKLPKVCEERLKLAAKTASDRVKLRNQLEAARSDAERLRHGRGKNDRLRQATAERVRELVRQEQECEAALQACVDSDAYRAGVRELARLITEIPTVEAVIAAPFGMAA